MVDTLSDERYCRCLRLWASPRIRSGIRRGLTVLTRLSRSGLLALPLVLLLFLLTVLPAAAHNGSKSDSWGPGGQGGCSWSGSQSYTGYPSYLATGATTSTCAYVQVKIRYLSSNGNWYTPLYSDTDGTVSKGLGADHLGYTDHNTKLYASHSYVGARINH